MKPAVTKFHTAAYWILAVLSLLMLIGTIVSVINGSTDLFTGGLAAVIFSVFTLIQIICLAVYKQGVSLYKIGFYLLHGGLLLMMVGFLAYAVAGDSMNVDVPVNADGSIYTSIQAESGETTDLGFGLKVDSFVLEKYEDTGNDKYYRANLTLMDPTTLTRETGILEVNHTLRRNGWKIYLMSYLDGRSTLQNLYGLTEDRFYETYSADGASAGSDLISLVQNDLGGNFISYYYYSEVNGIFYAIEEEGLAVIPGTLYAHTFVEGNQISVLVNSKMAAFSDSVNGDGQEILAYVAENYSEKTVHYYYYTAAQRAVTLIDSGYVQETLTGQVFAGINATDASVSVYIMAEEQKPDRSFTADGGSSLMASLTEVYGAKSVNITYLLYDRTTGGYAQATLNDLAGQKGSLKGYALYMNDEVVVYVHPASVLLLLKKDPGEFAVLAGIILLFAGTVLTCLIRKRTSDSDGSEKDENADQVRRSNSANAKRKENRNGKGGAQ